MRLSAVGCELESGVFNVILGRNGAGKTHLCRRLAGLDVDASEPSASARSAGKEPSASARSAGKVLLDGRAHDHRDSAMVFQEFVNYPSLTVHDNIASPMRARGEKRAYIAARVGELARMLGLGELLARLPAELSGGQQQRVAIARALAKNARVLVLDEPLGNLDYKLRESLAVELKALLGGEDRVLVYTTADPHEALALADHLVLLDAGRVLQAGAPLDVWRAPLNRVAADLLSDPGVNFSPAHMVNGTLRLNHTAGVAVPADAMLPSTAFLLGARPEHLRLARYRDSDICFEASVALAETNGSDTFLHVSVAELPWVAHVDGIVRPTPGTRLDLYLSAADMLTFELGA